MSQKAVGTQKLRVPLGSATHKWWPRPRLSFKVVLREVPQGQLGLRKVSS
jgi:hypothetical protein